MCSKCTLCFPAEHDRKKLVFRLETESRGTCLQSGTLCATTDREIACRLCPICRSPAELSSSQASFTPELSRDAAHKREAERLRMREHGHLAQLTPEQKDMEEVHHELSNIAQVRHVRLSGLCPTAVGIGAYRTVIRWRVRG